MENNNFQNPDSPDTRFVHASLQRQEVIIADLNNQIELLNQKNEDLDYQLKGARRRNMEFIKLLKETKDNLSKKSVELQDVSEENLNRAVSMRQMIEELYQRGKEIEDLKNQLDRSEARVIEFNTVPSNNPLIAS